MLEKIQIAVTGMTMVGVWTNMFINLKRVKELESDYLNKK